MVIDSIVKLTEDTDANAARLKGSAPKLKSKVTGEERLVSRNGGIPYAVLQLEDWNPSTATQKLNNLHQIFEAHPAELDSCCVFLFTDKGADHNPTHYEVMLREAEMFLDRKL